MSLQPLTRYPGDEIDVDQVLGIRSCSDGVCPKMLIDMK
jgi:hypothetical protein